ncbi:MAG: phage holin family protein [Rhodanobacter sp.]
MDAPQPGGFSVLQMLLFSVFAALGGLLGYVLRMMDAGYKVSLWRALIEAMAAGFVGVLVMLLCQAMQLSPQWTGLMVGVCGWLGATASIRMLERVVRNKLGVSDSDGTNGGKP